MAGPSTRADDMRLLWLLGARKAGWSARAAGAGFGLTGERVRTDTNRVRDADLRESGEPVDRVVGFYQWGA